MSVTVKVEVIWVMEELKVAMLPLPLKITHFQRYPMFVPFLLATHHQILILCISSMSFKACTIS
eukprot:1070534-Amphidinium_carterae.1